MSYTISTMVNRSCIVGCNSATHNCHGKKVENGLTFHRFPAWDQVSEITRSRRLAWIAAVRRPNISFHSIPMSMRVCSLHFHSSKLKMVYDFLFIHCFFPSTATPQSYIVTYVTHECARTQTQHKHNNIMVLYVFNTSAMG